MAKNRKQDRSRPKSPVSAGGPQQTEHSAPEPQPEHHAPVLNPTDMTPKGRKKRFGHN